MAVSDILPDETNRNSDCARGYRERSTRVVRRHVANAGVVATRASGAHGTRRSLRPFRLGAIRDLGDASGRAVFPVSNPLPAAAKLDECSGSMAGQPQRRAIAFFEIIQSIAGLFDRERGDAF